MSEHRYCDDVRAEIARLALVVHKHDEEIERLRSGLACDRCDLLDDAREELFDSQANVKQLTRERDEAQAVADRLRKEKERLIRARDEARALLRYILDEALCLSPLDGTCRQIKRPHDEWCAICHARDAMEKGEP